MKNISEIDQDIFTQCVQEMAKRINDQMSRPSMMWNPNTIVTHENPCSWEAYANPYSSPAQSMGVGASDASPAYPDSPRIVIEPPYARDEYHCSITFRIPALELLESPNPKEVFAQKLQEALEKIGGKLAIARIRRSAMPESPKLPLP